MNGILHKLRTRRVMLFRSNLPNLQHCSVVLDGNFNVSERNCYFSIKQFCLRSNCLKLFRGVFYKKVAGVIRLGFLSSLCLKLQRLQACRKLISIIGTIGLEFSLFSITFPVEESFCTRNLEAELTIAH